MAGISQIEINGTVFDICDATARDSLSQDYLPLTAGSTKPLTGTLYRQDNAIDSTDANNGIGTITDTKRDNAFVIIDKNGATITRLLSRTNKAGNQQGSIEASNWIESTNTRNWGRVGITLKKDGTSSNELTGEDTYFGNSSFDRAYLWAKMSTGTRTFLKIGGGVNTPGTSDGTVLRIGAGGLTLVGGGEYTENRYNLSDLADTTENLYLGSDNNVFIESNANTIADRKTWIFHKDGTFSAGNSIYLNSSNINRDGSNPSSDTLGTARLMFRDVDAERVGEVRISRLATGEIQTGLIAINEKSDQTEVFNAIYVKAAKNGTTSYMVSNATAFREAINAVRCENQSTMNAALTSLSANHQCWALRATVINSSNTTYKNHEVGLLMGNTYIGAYDFTTSTNIWSFVTTNTVASDANVIGIASGHTLDTATYYARNGIVQTRIAFKTSSTATGSHTIGTIVSGKRPVVMMYGSVSSSIMSNCTVEAGGAVKVYFNAAPSTSTVYNISFVYLLPNGDMA